MLLKFHSYRFMNLNKYCCYLLYSICPSREVLYALILSLVLLYQIQETSEENVLRLSCQDIGCSGSSGHGDEANQELLHLALDPSLHIG